MTLLIVRVPPHVPKNERFILERRSSFPSSSPYISILMMVFLKNLNNNQSYGKNDFNEVFLCLFNSLNGSRGVLLLLARPQRLSTSSVSFSLPHL